MKIRIIAWLLILVCVAASLSSCASGTDGKNKFGKIIDNIPNSDGEIGSAGGKKDHDYDYYAAADCGVEAGKAEAELREMPEDYDMTAYDVTEGGVKGHSYDIFDSQTVYKSGTLTAGEIRDNNSPTTFLGKFGDEKWSKIVNDWKIPVAKSLKVNVKNGDAPVKGAQMTLLDADGGVIRAAVIIKNKK